jgi:TPR repeat protein
VKTDYEKGVAYFHKAAEKGHAQAQMNLGVAYYTGNGVIPDPVKAYAWFYVASASSIKDAHETRMVLYDKLTEPERKQAVELGSEYKQKYYVSEFRSNF